MRLNQRTLALFLLASPAVTAAQQPPPKFDQYVKRVMETFTVPGLSVAIVKDGKVVLAKGYGNRMVAWSSSRWCRRQTRWISASTFRT